MANFETAYKLLSASEGGYSNNPNDTGGETYRGVARNYFPAWSGWTYIDRTKTEGLHGAPHLETLLPDQNARLNQSVRDFYKQNFWNRFRGDDIPDSFQIIAAELLDVSVNCGVHTAVSFLQQALNVLNQNGKFYPDVEIDGVLGNETLGILRVSRQEENDARLLHKVMNILQGYRYIQIMQKNPSQETFARGWLSRVTV